MKKSRQFRARARTVMEFHNSLAAMLSHMERGEKWGTRIPEMQPSFGDEGLVKELDDQTSRFAGRAVTAAGEYETLLELPIPYDGGTEDVPVIQRWRHAISYPEVFEPALLLGTLQQIVGRIEGEAELLMKAGRPSLMPKPQEPQAHMTPQQRSPAHPRPRSRRPPA